MGVKVMGEKLADTRSKVSLASSDRLRLDACALFGEPAVVVPLLRFHSLLIIIIAKRCREGALRITAILIDPIQPR